MKTNAELLPHVLRLDRLELLPLGIGKRGGERPGAPGWRDVEALPGGVPAIPRPDHLAALP